MQNQRKNFNFKASTIYKLELLKSESGKNHTELLESAVEYVFGEYLRAMKGMNHDDLAISHVLGKPIITDEEGSK